jgi:exonuclease VII small subunit
MWKKQDDAVPPLGSKLGDALTYLDSLSEKGKSAVGPQRVIAEAPHQPSTPATMAAYKEAVNEFTKNATELIGYLPLLSKARDAYEQAMSASAELHKVLDSGEENLRTLMKQLEQAVNLQVVKFAPDKKKPEPSRGTAEGTGSAKAL